MSMPVFEEGPVILQCGLRKILTYTNAAILRGEMDGQHRSLQFIAV